MRTMAITLLAGMVAAAGVFGIGATGALAAPPSTITVIVDDTFFLPGTSAACGFDVYEHDYGSLTESTTYLPGATRIMQRSVHIDSDYFAPSTGKSITVHPGGVGPYTETDYADGTVVLFARGTNGMITVPGLGLVFASSGTSIVTIDPSGNVIEVQHGNFSEDHSGICPLLAP